jgi:hypothetical protein
MLYREESKMGHDDTLPMITGIDPDLNQTQLSRHMKLEPLNVEKHSSHNENENKQLEEQTDDLDIDNLMSGANSTKSMILRSPHSPNKEANSMVDKSNRSDIPDKYDNQTTQNLCDLMNQANMSIH